jgi:glutaredoxin
MIKKITPLLLIIVIVFVFFKITSKPQDAIDDSQAKIILFWGEGCPHCENVEEYITDNKIDQQLVVSRKEVYYHKQNQLLMAQKADRCPEIDQSVGIGVPMAYFVDEDKCHLGDTPIIEAIKEKLKSDQ